MAHWQVEPRVVLGTYRKSPPAIGAAITGAKEPAAVRIEPVLVAAKELEKPHATMGIFSFV